MTFDRYAAYMIINRRPIEIPEKAKTQVHSEKGQGARSSRGCSEEEHLHGSR